MSRINSEASRVKALEKQRASFLSQTKKQKEQIEKDTSVKVTSDKFVAQNDWVDSALKQKTIGLVQLEDFQRIRSELEDEKKLQQEKAIAAEKVKLKNREKRKKARKDAILSFDLEEDGEKVELEPTVKKIKKNPLVDTSFLPDRDREEQERLEREKLETQWKIEQEAIKKEKILITYSYWDGSGHRKSVECVKGDSIGQFLEKCKAQTEEIRNINVDNLIYVKEDLIIPHHYTFYDFILNKTRGKSGPLFSFDVKDDVRLVNDASIESENSHAGKVMQRSWYEANKHIFPASRWEVFDPSNEYGKYTIKG